MKKFIKKYCNKYGIRLIYWNFFSLFLKLRIFIYSTFFKNKFNNTRTDIIKNGYELTFFDDFITLNRNVWRTDLWWGFRYYSNTLVNDNKAPLNYLSDNAFTIDNSILKIKTEYNPIEIHHIEYDGKDYGKFTIPYQSGSLDSSISFMQKYGYFEIRCKMPNSKNMWPAFWLASKHSWPPEIDIFEVYTTNMSTSTSTIHWDKEPNKLMTGFNFKTPKLDDDFHIWSCSWDINYIKIYFDGILVRKTPTPYDFVYDMQIILGSSVHKEDIINTNLPNYLEVDYVKAYKKI